MSTDGTGDAEYEPYTETSQSYDQLRRSIGVDSLENALSLASSTLEVPVDKLHLLDVGCGTGNYINSIREKVGFCQGLEFNEGMLA